MESLHSIERTLFTSFFQSREFYDAQQLLISDARSLQPFYRLWLPSWIEWHNIASLSCRYRSDARQADFLYCELHDQKFEVLTVAEFQPRKTRKSRLQSNETHETRFSNLWLLQVKWENFCQTPGFHYLQIQLNWFDNVVDSLKADRPHTCLKQQTKVISASYEIFFSSYHDRPGNQLMTVPTLWWLHMHVFYRVGPI